MDSYVTGVQSFSRVYVLSEESWRQSNKFLISVALSPHGNAQNNDRKTTKLSEAYSHITFEGSYFAERDNDWCSRRLRILDNVCYGQLFFGEFVNYFDVNWLC